MFWQDIFVSKALSKIEIVSAFSKVFSIDGKNIKITSKIESITCGNNSSVICQTYKTNAEFPLRLSVYIIDDKIIPKDDKVILRQLSKELSCDILMSDDSFNPYYMLRIYSNGSIKQVSIDLDAYDDAVEFELQ